MDLGLCGGNMTILQTQRISVLYANAFVGAVELTVLYGNCFGRFVAETNWF